MVHEHLRIEHLPLRLEILGQLGADPREAGLRLAEITALIPDLREEKPGAVVQLGLDRLLQDALEDLAREAVLAV